MKEIDLEKNYEALAIAIVEQAAKDGVKSFFLSEHSPISIYMPNVDAPKMWEEIENNRREYGTYRKLEDGEIESKWKAYKQVKFDSEGKLKQNWFIFRIGEPRWIIEEWFDEHYSKGLAGLSRKRGNEWKESLAC